MTFNCTIDVSQSPQLLTCDVPYISQITNGSDTYYVNSMWSAEGLFVSLLMVILIVIILAKSLFYFLFPKLVKIAKK